MQYCTRQNRTRKHYTNQKIISTIIFGLLLLTLASCTANPTKTLEAQSKSFSGEAPNILYAGANKVGNGVPMVIKQNSSTFRTWDITIAALKPYRKRYLFWTKEGGSVLTAAVQELTHTE